MRVRRLNLLSVPTAVIVGIACILLLFFVSTVRADVYNTLYATSCLGGWENTSLASGAPDAPQEDGVSTFNESNSARLSPNAHAQIYCGSFSGDIIEQTIPKKIVVKFSWGVTYLGQEKEIATTSESEVGTSTVREVVEATTTSSEEVVTEPVTEVPENEVATTSPENTEEEVSEATLEVAPPLEEVPSTEPVTEPSPSVDEPTSFLRLFAKTAYAQEEVAEVSTSTSEEATTTPEFASSTTEKLPYGIVEVLYTLDGVDWKSLGYVEREQFKDAQFVIPIEEASRWEDISKIQIGIQSVPVLDDVESTVYLDSVWLEVEYQKPWEDPLAPPGEKKGDTILKEVSYGDFTAVLLSRESEWLFGARVQELWIAYSTPDEDVTLQEESAAPVVIDEIENTEQATTSTSSIETTILEFAENSTTTLSTIAGLPSKKQWRLVADDSIISDTAQLYFSEGSLFWFGKRNTTLWRFNPQSNAYDSVSINEGELPTLYFQNESGEQRMLQSTLEGSFNILDVPEAHE